MLGGPAPCVAPDPQAGEVRDAFRVECLPEALVRVPARQGLEAQHLRSPQEQPPQWPWGGVLFMPTQPLALLVQKMQLPGGRVRSHS